MLSQERNVVRDFSCETLGVVINLQHSANGEASISNTRSRIDELVHDLRFLTSDKSITHVQAQRLRGRMQFAESQLFGRAGIRALSSVAEGFAKTLNQRDIDFILLFCEMIESGPPRKLTAKSADCFHVFRDACSRSSRVALWCRWRFGLCWNPQSLFLIRAQIRCEIQTGRTTQETNNF